MRKIFLVFLLLNLSFAQNLNFDVKEYHINLDLDKNAQTIAGYTELKILSRVNNLSQVDLSLLQLNVDSVTANNSALTFSYNDTTISITLPGALNAGDSLNLKVYYHGTPKKDASFGGFYFSGQYAYNLGVGMSAIPHTFGRVWFPCVDTFTMRSLYSFAITTDSADFAVCNGILDSSKVVGSKRTNYWHLNQTIPTYLASVAVAPYVAVKDTFVSITGDSIPVSNYALSAFVGQLNGSFVNLENAFHIYEDKFGPYLWDRVGYVLVPFNYGAMEHATNVAYPLITVNGNTAYESILVHELSHHWFGNLVTCQEAAEMWLNEGFASYCEAVFMENQYGHQSYVDYVRKNHDKVLRLAHINDGDYYPLKGVPQSVTYGSTSYEKGADVIHTLRFYMGDSAFFSGLNHYLNKYKFSHVNSDSLQKALEEQTGDSLGDFFLGWVKTAGFPAFIIDSVQVKNQGSNYLVTLYATQKLKGSFLYRHSNRLPVYFLTPADTLQRFIMKFDGASGKDSFLVNYNPVAIFYDIEGQVSDAKITDFKKWNSVGTLSYKYCRNDITVSSITDSGYVQSIYYFTGPTNTSGIPSSVRVSTEHFWKLEGKLPSYVSGQMKFYYNGTTSGVDGYLDRELFQGGVPEDSLVIYYRRNASEPWQEIPYTLPQANFNNQIGYVLVDTIMLGEFVLGAKGFAPVKIEKKEPPKLNLKMFPNPNKGVLKIETEENLQGHTFKLYDLNGAIIFKELIDTTGTEFEIQLPPFLIPSMYVAVFEDPEGKVVYREKIMIITK